LCINLLPDYQNLCPKCTQWLIRDATADSSINDQLIKLHSTHSWIRFVMSSSVSFCHLSAIFSVKC